jgi:hypothetical protein
MSVDVCGGNNGTDQRPTEYLNEEEVTEIPWNNNANEPSVSPPRSAIDQTNLEDAPVEREAGIQILKAWQALERKAAREELHGEGDDDDGEEDVLFPTLEDDNDAVVLSRLAQNKGVDSEGKEKKHQYSKSSRKSLLPGKQ